MKHLNWFMTHLFKNAGTHDVLVKTTTRLHWNDRRSYSHKRKVNKITNFNIYVKNQISKNQIPKPPCRSPWRSADYTQGFIDEVAYCDISGSTLVFLKGLVNKTLISFSLNSALNDFSVVFCSGDCRTDEESDRCRSRCFESGHGQWLHLYHTGRWVYQ